MASENDDETSKIDSSIADQSNIVNLDIPHAVENIKSVINSGDVERLHKFIKNGQHCDINSFQNQSTLDIAIKQNSVAMVNALLDNGANINAYQVGAEHGFKVSRSPLITACFRGNIEIISLLINRGVYIDDNLLYLCLTTLSSDLESKERRKIFSLLIRHINDVNFAYVHGGTFLHVICENNYIDLVQDLLKRGADRDALDQYGSDVLRVAAGHGYIDMVRLILGWDTNRPMLIHRVGYALIAAARSLNFELVRLLTEYGVNPEALTTALAAASFRGSESYPIAEFLINHGADVHTTDAGRALWGRVFEALIPDTDTADFYDEGDTESDEGPPLGGHASTPAGGPVQVEGGPSEATDDEYGLTIAKLYLEHGADANYVNTRSGESLLMSCCGYERNAVKMSTLLLQHGADVNYMNPRTGATVLITAATTSNRELVKLYLEYGADIMIADHTGYTVLDMLSASPQVLYYPELLELCQQYIDDKPVLK